MDNHYRGCPVAIFPTEPLVRDELEMDAVLPTTEEDVGRIYSG
jgi:hypothetical protein